MYPLNMQLAAPAVGFAVANDEAEHQALTATGYGPGFVASEPTKATKAAAKPAAE
jgi:hypothetical protein